MGDTVDTHTRFPVADPSVSFWLSQPSELAHFKSQPSPPEHVDVAIIGSGLSGVSVAYHLLKECELDRCKPRVAIFEARTACSGATGRNGGHTKIQSSSIKALQERWGDEVAAAMARTAVAQRHLMQEIIEQEDIDCDFFLTRSFDVFFDKTEAKEMHDWLTTQKKPGSPLHEATCDMQFFDGPNVERVTGVKGAIGAVSSPAASLWPYKLVIGLLARVLEIGCEFYADHKVIEVSALEENADDAANALRFENPASQCGPMPMTRARHVIFATNGYTSALLSDFSKAITPIRGTASHLVVDDSHKHESTAPPFLSHTYNLRYSSGFIDYLVPRPDGTIIVGGAGHTFKHDRSKWWDNVDDAHLIEDARFHFDKRMQTVYHGWEGSEAHVGAIWTGIMGSTTDGMPHVGPVPRRKGQWIVAGFNGGGMSMILTSTKALARMLLEKVEAWKDLGLPAPFEPKEARLYLEHYAYA